MSTIGHAAADPLSVTFSDRVCVKRLAEYTPEWTVIISIDHSEQLDIWRGLEIHLNWTERDQCSINDLKIPHSYCFIHYFSHITFLVFTRSIMMERFKKSTVERRNVQNIRGERFQRILAISPWILREFVFPYECMAFESNRCYTRSPLCFST